MSCQPGAPPVSVRRGVHHGLPGGDHRLNADSPVSSVPAPFIADSQSRHAGRCRSTRERGCRPAGWRRSTRRRCDRRPRFTSGRDPPTPRVPGGGAPRGRDRRADTASSSACARWPAARAVRRFVRQRRAPARALRRPTRAAPAPAAGAPGTSPASRPGVAPANALGRLDLFHVERSRRAWGYWLGTFARSGGST